MEALSIENHNRLTKWLWISLVLTVLFFSLGFTVERTTFFDALNQATLVYLIHHHTHVANVFFINATLLCEPPYYYALALALIIWLILYRRWLLAAHFFITFNMVYYSSNYFKHFFQVARPSEGIVNISYAYPSGHTLFAFVVFGFWSLVFTQHLTGKTKYKMMLVYNMPAIIVGLSRLYLGVHWLTDVVGGFLIAWVFNLIGFFVYSLYETYPVKPDKLLYSFIGLTAMVFFYLVNMNLDQHLQFYEHITDALLIQWP